MSFKEISRIIHSQNIHLFCMGFVQLLFLSSGMYYIARLNYIMIMITMSIQSVVFSYAMTKIAFSNNMNRIIYSVGCTCGCIVGTWLASKS